MTGLHTETRAIDQAHQYLHNQIMAEFKTLQKIKGVDSFLVPNSYFHCIAQEVHSNHSSHSTGQGCCGGSLGKSHIQFLL